MTNSSNDKIISYLKSPSRNKIILHKEQLEDIIPINVGKELSNRLAGITESHKLSLIAKQELDELFNSSCFEHHNYGRTLSITNLGILFEPELKINFNYILSKYSSDNLLLIQWKGAVEQNTLYFLSSDGIQISLENLSYITL